MENKWFVKTVEIVAGVCLVLLGVHYSNMYALVFGGALLPLDASVKDLVSNIGSL